MKTENLIKLRWSHYRVALVSAAMEREGPPGGSGSKESACNVGDPGLIPGSGRFPGGGHGYPIQYSCLENPMDIGVWRATVHGNRKESNTTQSLTQTVEQKIYIRVISLLNP